MHNNNSLLLPPHTQDTCSSSSSSLRRGLVDPKKNTPWRAKRTHTQHTSEKKKKRKTIVIILQHTQIYTTVRVPAWAPLSLKPPSQQVAAAAAARHKHKQTRLTGEHYHHVSTLKLKPPSLLYCATLQKPERTAREQLRSTLLVLDESSAAEHIEYQLTAQDLESLHQENGHRHQTGGDTQMTGKAKGARGGREGERNTACESGMPQNEDPSEGGEVLLLANES